MARHFTESISRTGLVLCCEVQGALFNVAVRQPGVPGPQVMGCGAGVSLETSQRWEMPCSLRCTVWAQVWLQITELTCCPGLEGQLWKAARGMGPATPVDFNHIYKIRSRQHRADTGH